jgi:hypothetical protein
VRSGRAGGHDHHHHDHHHHHNDHGHGHDALEPTTTQTTRATPPEFRRRAAGCRACRFRRPVERDALHRLAFGLALIVAFSFGLAATITGSASSRSSHACLRRTRLMAR